MMRLTRLIYSGTPPRPTGRGHFVKLPPLIQQQHAQAKGKRPVAPQLPRVGIAEFLSSGPDLKPVSKKAEFHDFALPGRRQKTEHFNAFLVITFNLVCHTFFGYEKTTSRIRIRTGLKCLIRICVRLNAVPRQRKKSLTLMLNCGP